MPRVTRGTTVRKKHKKLFKQNKGYGSGRNRRIKVAKEAQLHALAHAHRGRKQKKRDYRSLWISRINIALHKTGDVSYSTFIHSMNAKNIELDRKTLAYLATDAPQVFKAVVKFVMSK